MSDRVIRILLAALGGEGGGVLMNWIVSAARKAGHPVQATSVPGVAQRTGSTSYYVEIAPRSSPDSVLGLVPLPGRVDVVVSSEMVETARVMSAGFISPRATTVISSTARVYATAEKIALGDGRADEEVMQQAIQTMAKECFLLDLTALASDHQTFVSATMFGALAGSGALPFGADQCRDTLVDDRSRAGFDAALGAVDALKAAVPPESNAKDPDLPESLSSVLTLGVERCADFQDAAYGALFRARAERLINATDLADHRALHAVTEASRRLALWMAYEDIARVADLKTRPERFAKIRQEAGLTPGQVLTVTDYMKPRAEEIADALPVPLGRWIQRRAERGGWFPFLGKGRTITSNGVFGYRALRLVAALKRIRRRSLRFTEEQAAIETWLAAMERAIKADPDFAMGLGELPRVLKGYSDTLLRGKSAYERIWNGVVAPALEDDGFAKAAPHLRTAIGAALADDSHTKLGQVLDGTPDAPPILTS